MGLFRRSQPPEEERSFTLKQLGVMVQEQTTGGAISITETEQALRNAAVWACIDVLAGSISSLPLDSVRVQGEIRVPVRPVPSLIEAPSSTATLDVWLYQLAFSMLTDGNAFGLITASDRDLRPTSIELLDPIDVRSRQVKDGVPTVQFADGEHALYPFGDVWHVPGKMTLPGKPFALSPLKYAGVSIGAALAAERFSSRFFTDGGHPTAKITSDQHLTEEQAQGVKAAYRKAVSAGSREPLVMGAGLDYEQLQVNPSDSQFLELMRFEVEQVCRFYRVPPSMVYGAVSGQSVTYANVSQSDLHYMKHSLDGYLVRIEKALSALLPRPQHVKFNRDALLRADTMTRYEAHQVALEGGFLTVNEVRELEDKPPFAEPAASLPPEPEEPDGLTP